METSRTINRRERGKLTRVDSAHEPNTTPRKRSDLESAPASAEADDGEDTDESEADVAPDQSDGQHLSRAERRRLRKKMRREQRQSN